MFLHAVRLRLLCIFIRLVAIFQFILLCAVTLCSVNIRISVLTAVACFWIIPKCKQ
jgi:hypothetical protein